jgi:hypothetical protein
VKEVIKSWSEYYRRRPLAESWKRIVPLLLSLLWLCAIAWVAFLWHLGNIGLVDETEPLFAEAARQMTVTGDWITPYFNGATRFDKPPLIYWLMAVAYRTLGVNEWAVRLPSALCAIALTCLGFYTLSKTEGRRKKEERSSATDSLTDVTDVTEKSEGIFSPTPPLPHSPNLSFYSLDWCGINSFKSRNYCLGADWRFRYAISCLYVFGTSGVFPWLHPRRTETKSRISHRCCIAISE